MYIASASTTVKFHELSSSTTSFHYQPGSKVEGPIRSISWSKEGHWLAVVPHSGQVEVVSVKTDQLKLVYVVQDVTEPSCAAFQFNSKKYLAIGTKHGQVLLYDIKSRSTKKRFPRTSCTITHVGFTGRDSHCVAGCSNGEVLVYNNVSNTVSCTLKVPKSTSVTALRTHMMKRNVIAGGSNEGVVVVWDSNVSKSKFQAEAHKSPVTGVALSPINSSLLISTGMDRQFSIYDIDDKQRITCVPLENTPTAVDFIDDSTYFAIGSQNGKVHMFDARKLQEPVHSFDAHQSAIKHLLFQRPDESVASHNSSLGSLIGEDIRTIKSNAEMGNTNKKKRSSDVFGYVAQGPAGSSDTFDGSKKPYVVAGSLEAGDSFIKALGLDCNNTADSFYQDSPREDNMHLNVPEKRTSLGFHFTPNSKLLENVSESKGILKQTTSTPKLLQNFLSPIPTSIKKEPATSSISNITIADIQGVTRDIIQNEIKDALDKVKNEMLYHVTEAKMQLKTLIMDVQFSNFKEFNRVIENCNMIRDEMGSEGGTTHENFLLEENLYLKRKVEMLETQLASLAVEKHGINGNQE